MLFFKKTLKGFLLFLLMSPLVGNGQVKSDRSIIMTGSTDSLRQIQNLGYPVDSLSGLNASDARNNSVIYGNVTGQDSLTLTLSPSISGYNKGMVVIFKADTLNTKSLNFRIDGNPYVYLRDHNGENLSAGSLTGGQVVMAVYDGSGFRLIDPRSKSCPPGFVEVTDNYCIEINERSAIPISAAQNLCYAMQARLCTWQEWYYACQKASLGLTNMSGNWEYLDDSSNHSNTVHVAGYSTCTSNHSVTFPATATFNFRCCFSR